MAEPADREGIDEHGTRHRGFIPWSWVDRQLRGLRSIWVSTTRPDGRPHAVPVWFTWNGRTFYFASHESAQKVQNLELEPWVVIHGGNGDDAVILEGRVEIVIDRTELEQVDRDRGQRYVEPRTGARDTIMVEGTVVYRVQIQHVMAWMYGDMRSRTDWWFS
jgi:nitroimidazol reductase NimA-like FMN-containing flavoprotein (pyridoxamine 5'-phosphate oxidase superfamily)